MPLIASRVSARRRRSRAPPAVGPRTRRARRHERVEQRQQVGRHLRDRGALALDGGLVAPRHRSGQRPLGPEPRPVLDRGADQRHELRAVDAGRAGDPLGRRLERDQEVRRDRRRRVVRGAVSLGDLDRPHPERVARFRSRNRSARGVLPAIAAPAPAKSAPSAVTVISGCNENASCGASSPRPVAPEQWPTSGPGAMCAAARAISASGTHSSTASAPAPSAPRPSGPDTSWPARSSAVARAVPSRPRPTMARRYTQGCQRTVPVPVPAFEIPVGGEKTTNSRQGPSARSA